LADEFQPGIYHVQFKGNAAQSTDVTQGVFDGNCLVTVNAQSRMQLFYGYNTGSDSLTNDYPVNEPSKTSSLFDRSTLMRAANNRFVANFTNSNEIYAQVQMVEFYDTNYNLLQVCCRFS